MISEHYQPMRVDPLHMGEEVGPHSHPSRPGSLCAFYFRLGRHNEYVLSLFCIIVSLIDNPDSFGHKSPQDVSTRGDDTLHSLNGSFI